MKGVARTVVLLALLAFAGMLPAQTRAWLDRDRIALGESATLNVETDASSAPDYAPLLADFDLSGQASQQQLQWINGRASAHSLYAVALRPRREGLLRIPPMRVGGAVTAPLTLLVTAAPVATAASGGDVFIESEADAQDPYVQQSVGWVVRLYSAIPLIAGQLDQPEPQGATLRRVGEDVQYRRTVGARSYVVTERRYLLIPERSGELTVPSARFEGRGTGNAFDRLFGDGQAKLHAIGRPRVLHVRPIPADAPQPWLPLRALTLRYVEQPRSARAGGASTVRVDVVADGVAASQLPLLEIPPARGVQVFPERPQSDESMVDGRPRAHVERRFSVLPTQPGRLVLPGPRIDWWDTRAGVARSTQLPPIVLDVAPGEVTEPAEEVPADGVPSARGSGGRRIAIGVGLVLALGLLGWGVARNRRGAADVSASTNTSDAVPMVVDSTSRAPDARVEVAPTPDLARVLAGGDLARIDATLRALAGVDVRDLDAVMARLDDRMQRDAVEALRAARWAGGDVPAALARLRTAFAPGPRWRAWPRAARDELPPLYPGA